MRSAGARCCATRSSSAWSELALANNRDLRTAALNVAQAEAQYRIQRGELLPQIGATGALTAQRTPASLSPGGAAITSGGWSGGIGFTAYEVDLFGRVRSLSQQAFEQYLGYDETRRASQISLIAQVANAWLALLGDRELLALTEQTLANQQDALRLTQAGFDGGNATALALRQAQTAVETARASLAQYTRQQAQDINALNLLVGTTLPPECCPPAPLDGMLVAEVPAGMDSTILVRRPGRAGGRAQPARRQCECRRGKGGLLPLDHADRQRGHGERQLQPALLRRFNGELELRAADQRADLLGRRATGQPRRRQGPDPAAGRGLRAHHPDRLPRGGGRAGGARHLRHADRRRRRRWSMPMPMPTASRCCASAAGSTPIRRRWTRSGSSSPRSRS
jgi:hypothetical protein